jgi:predicted Fe-Mo cluster-binding NifX family protein
MGGSEMGTHRILIALGTDGSVSGGLGRARRVAVCEASADGVHSWEETSVGWDATHDTQPHGTHHGTIVQFLEDRRLEAVLAGHAGAPMQAQLKKLGIAFLEYDGVSPQAAAKHAAGLLDFQAEGSLKADS